MLFSSADSTVVGTYFEVCFVAVAEIELYEWKLDVRMKLQSSIKNPSQFFSISLLCDIVLQILKQRK